MDPSPEMTIQVKTPVRTQGRINVDAPVDFLLVHTDGYETLVTAAHGPLLTAHEDIDGLTWSGCDGLDAMPEMSSLRALGPSLSAVGVESRLLAELPLD
ncbi:MAG: hypothetical protein JO257_12305 [Deltaproteobacteria bacterium]|nr:hypothetical protein [Deltaproteobacteria bacterium]